MIKKTNGAPTLTRPKNFRISADQEAMLLARYPHQAAISLQYAVDCVFADAFGEPYPQPGVKRKAEGQILSEEKLATMDPKAARNVRYVRKHRKNNRESA